VINLDIERHILDCKQGIIKIWASYSDSEELKTVREEMERLGFNIREQEKSRNRKTPNKIAGDYLYSNNYDKRDEKLVELTNIGYIFN